jgi:hypothetical protein
MDELKKALSVSRADDDSSDVQYPRARKSNDALQISMERIASLRANLEGTIANWTAYDFLAYWITLAREQKIVYIPSVARDCNCFKRFCNLYGKIQCALCIEYIFGGKNHRFRETAKPTILVAC